MFDIYKPAQGKYTRWITFAAGFVLAAIGAYWLSNRLQGTAPYIQYGVPVVVLAVISFVLFRVVNRPNSADFMIATEGEMKKVSWSSWREIKGSTKVVIFTTFALALMLFLVDVVFQRLFSLIGVLKLQS